VGAVLLVCHPGTLHSPWFGCSDDHSGFDVDVCGWNSSGRDLCGVLGYARASARHRAAVVSCGCVSVAGGYTSGPVLAVSRRNAVEYIEVVVLSVVRRRGGARRGELDDVAKYVAHRSLCCEVRSSATRREGVVYTTRSFGVGDARKLGVFLEVRGVCLYCRVYHGVV
jgi:hypothetical protein